MRPVSFIAAAFLLLIPATFAASAIDVWPVDSLIKVFPDDSPGKNRAPDQPWLMPRNGHTSVQFAVRSTEAVEALAVSIKLGGGLKPTVYRTGYVPVRFNSKDTPVEELLRSAPSKFPDPLFEESTFALPAGETTPVWITVYAPAGAKPGMYKGEAIFRAGKRSVAKARFRIQVSRAIVPAKQKLRITNWFGVDRGSSGDADHYWEFVGNLARVIGEHRQNVILTPVLSLTDARVNDGSLVYDFSRLDRWVDTFTKAGAAELIEGGHLMSRSKGYDSPLILPAFVVENGEVRIESISPEDPRAEAHLNSFLPALYAHLKEKGWLGRYVQHVLDEAHGNEPPVYLRYVGIVRKLLPGVKTIDAIDQTAGLLGEACDIWVPQLGRFDKDFDAIREHVGKGGEAWYYTCLYPRGRHLNRLIDYPLIKTRLLHWFNFRHDFTGYLHWGGNYWGADPYGDTEVSLASGEESEVLPPGDAFITYPWREKNTIRPSIRLSAMREGIEDYELLQVVAAKNPEKARELARKAVPELTDYVRDVPAFRQLQAELLAAAE
jgi:Domain of unknown function (DUF4091)